MTQQGDTARIQQLIEAMTLEEKVGQLNMLTAEMAVTGPVVSADYMAALRTGRLGSMLNLYVEATREVQRVAVDVLIALQRLKELANDLGAGLDFFGSHDPRRRESR